MAKLTRILTNIISIFFIFFVVYNILADFHPSIKKRREEKLYNEIPIVCVFGRTDSLKDSLKMCHPNSNITSAENIYTVLALEKEVVIYYETELKKLGWSKFDLKVYKEPKNKMLRQYRSTKKNSPDIVVEFVVPQNNEKLQYKLKVSH